VHRRRHESVDEYRTRFLVDFVFDRIGAHWDLDDHVAVVGNILASGNALEAHRGAFMKWRNWEPGYYTAARSSHPMQNSVFPVAPFSAARPGAPLSRNADAWDGDIRFLPAL